MASRSKAFCSRHTMLCGGILRHRLGLLILCAAMLYTCESRRPKGGVSGSVHIGDSSAQVENALGKPGQACSPAVRDNWWIEFPLSIPRADGDRIRRRLLEQTQDVWIYHFSGRRGDDCVCAYNDALIGVKAGVVLWYVPACSESVVKY